MDRVEQRMVGRLDRELTTLETRIYDHLATTFRWLTATLFAANGGAIIALMSAGQDLRPHFYALAWFACGTILSILTGAFSAWSGLRVLPVMARARGAVLEATVSDEIGEVEQRIVELVEKTKISWKTWMPSYACVASLMCFVAGIANVGASMA